jgi:hypothetical protein
MGASGERVPVAAANPGDENRMAREGLVSETSFLRLVELPFATVAAALEALWASEQHDGFVAVGPNAVMGRPNLENGVGHASVVVRRGWGPVGGSLPMELEFSPWSELRPVTRLELIAQRRSSATRRYFGTGHQVLDTIIAELPRRIGRPRHLQVEGVRGPAGAG